jgi:hypothetical protein
VLWSTISLPRRVPQLAGTDMRPPPLRERPGPERPQPIFIGTLNGCRWALPCPALRQVILPPGIVENLFDGIPVGVRPAFATGLLPELVPDLQCQPHRLPKPPSPACGQLVTSSGDRKAVQRRCWSFRLTVDGLARLRAVRHRILRSSMERSATCSAKRDKKPKAKYRRTVKFFKNLAQLYKV